MFGLRNKDNGAKDSNIIGHLKHGLEKTRAGLFYDLGDLFRKQDKIDAHLMEEIETRLLMADVGIEATSQIIDKVSAALKQQKTSNTGVLFDVLQQQMQILLEPVEDELDISSIINKPVVILVVGVNGAGKTTTIGKLAFHYKKQGHSLMLAAGDTFRAAATEQIQTWANRNEISVITQQSGADPAAVIYDALQSAAAQSTDILIADTAGRLHNKNNLMEELKKIRRIIKKFNPELFVETLLVLDAGTGQNALAQAEQFNGAIGIDGLVLTKLDGTAKGGIVFALAQKFKIPIRFIGIGEQINDLRLFQAHTFVSALLAD